VSSEYTVELRVSGHALGTSAVTSALGLEPTQIRQAGQRRSENSVFSENLWALDISASAGSTWNNLEEGLNALIELLSDKKAKLEMLRKSGDVYIWCGLFTNGFAGSSKLPPDVLRNLADLQLPVLFETYSANSSV
jgi:hypothetical protein